MPTWVDKILNSQSVQFALAALAFLIALWLVIVIARMLMGGRLRLPGGRSRQPRLGIVDAFDLDRQRQLIIVRRDNTEHLIMIGGPNDLLIESEIVRVEAREFRDGRRDKLLEPQLDMRGSGDGRIPAPVGVPAGVPMPVDVVPDQMVQGQMMQGPGGRAEERPMPQALSQAAPLPLAGAAPPFDLPRAEPNVDAAPPPLPRAPTFPLPPRRPTPTPVAPERRPPPPDRPTRGPDVPNSGSGNGSGNGSGIGPGVAPAVPQATMMPNEAVVEAPLPLAPPGPMPPPAPAAAEPMPAAAPTSSSAGELPAARPARPSPYLKPLPPRPPIRPLRRVTPQLEPGAPTVIRPSDPPAPVPQQAPAPQPAPAPVPPEPAAPIAPPQVAERTPPSSPEPHPESVGPDKDALESLEEEMAKLLGRGG